MSNINVDTIKNRSGSGAPGFPNGLTVTGVATATTFSGNLTGNVTGNLISSGVSTVSTLKFSYETTPIISPANSTYTIYISDSGNDSTGDGSSGNPYRSLGTALDKLPYILIAQPVEIRILGASYTNSSGVYFTNKGGQATSNYWSGAGITIRGDSGIITFNTDANAMEFEDIMVPIRFKNLNFVTPNGDGNYGIFVRRCEHFRMYDT